jgi:hypothetical protein
MARSVREWFPVPVYVNCKIARFTTSQAPASRCASRSAGSLRDVRRSEQAMFFPQKPPARSTDRQVSQSSNADHYDVANCSTRRSFA